MAVRKTTKKTLVKQSAMGMPVPMSVNESSMLERIKQPKTFVPLIIIVLIIVAFLLKGLFIAALVNGQPISRISIIQELEKQGGKQALSALVNQTLILQEAKKKNINVTQKDLDVQAKQIEDSLKTQGQNLDSALSLQGMTRQDFLMQLKLRTLVEKLLGSKVTVTDKEIADYMETNKATLSTNLTPDEVKAGVKQQLEQQKLATASQAWLAGLQKSAKINYFVNY